MGVTRRAAMAVAAAGALTLAACGGSDGAAVTTTSTATSPTGASATDTTAGPTSTTGPVTTATGPGDTTTTTESSEGRDTETSVLDTLPDGRHEGFMAGMETGTVEGQEVQVILFDEVELLTGEAAAQAATEHGDESPPPNDVYIVNDTQTLRRLAVVPDASITTLRDGSSEPVPSSVDAVAFDSQLYAIEVGNVRGTTTVSLIEAVYLP